MAVSLEMEPDFLDSFAASVFTLQTSIPSADTVAALHALSPPLDSLHTSLAAASSSLAAYDLRRAQESLAALSAALAERTDLIAPRPPFRFRRRRQHVAPAPQTPSPSTRTADPVDDANAVVIADISDGAVTISAAGRDVVLRRLRNARITVRGVASAVRGADITDSVIVFAPVAGAVHLSGVQRSEVRVAAHQLRFHDCVDCVFCVRSATAAVIEGCVGLAFSAYGVQYEGVEEEMMEAGLVDSPVEGGVKDFSWMREGESPNWRRAEADVKRIEGGEEGGAGIDFDGSATAT